MEGNKSSGPDMFTMTFFQQCWRVVKVDVMTFFANFHRHYEFDKSLNASFLALIPRKKNATNLRDFRPSALCGVYKPLAKVLANRMWNCKPCWISSKEIKIHCDVAYVLWCSFQDVEDSLGVAIDGSRSFVWGRNWFGKRSSDVWNLTSLCLMWIVWKECNSHTFEDNEKSLEQQKSL